MFCMAFSVDRVSCGIVRCCTGAAADVEGGAGVYRVAPESHDDADSIRADIGGGSQRLVQCARNLQIHADARKIPIRVFQGLSYISVPSRVHRD